MEFELEIISAFSSPSLWRGKNLVCIFVSESPKLSLARFFRVYPDPESEKSEKGGNGRRNIPNNGRNSNKDPVLLYPLVGGRAVGGGGGGGRRRRMK